jgi:DNA-binding response OmpR family regulator
VDWLLKSRVSGLHVARVLYAVDSSVRTVLMTGYLSTDLRGEAVQSGVVDFLEKPFRMDAVVRAVERALSGRPGGSPIVPAVALLDADRMITHANDEARRLFGSTRVGVEASSLETLLGGKAEALLEGARDGWVEVAPLARDPLRWTVRAGEFEGCSALVIVPEGQPFWMRHETVAMLLDRREGRAVSWPYVDRVLVIDDRSLARKANTQLLENAGAVCYKADSCDLALRLFRADGNIRIVVLDCERAPHDLEKMIGAMRAVRPGVRILGGPTLADLPGVKRYLPQSWVVQDLVDVLA